MNKRRPGRNKSPGCPPPLFKTKADVIEPNAVGIKTFAARSEYSNNLRNEVDYLTQFRFLLAGLVVRPLAIVYINTRSIPLHDVFLLVAHCDFLVQHPTVLPVSSPNSRFVQEGFATRYRSAPRIHHSLDVFGMD